MTSDSSREIHGLIGDLLREGGVVARDQVDQIIGTPVHTTHTRALGHTPPPHTLVLLGGGCAKGCSVGDECRCSGAVVLLVVRAATKVGDKTLLLDNPERDPALVKKSSVTQQRKKLRLNRGHKVLSAAVRRENKVYDVPPEVCSYAGFLPLHELWKQYFSELVGDAPAAQAVQKVPACDLHGAILTGTPRAPPTLRERRASEDMGERASERTNERTAGAR